MLDFSQRVLSEWTDGKLVVQELEESCNNELCGHTRRLFQYGRAVPITKSMRWITGWNDGPRGQARHWSAEELDLMMQRWLHSIPETETTDYQIVESVQLLLRGALPQGAIFDDRHCMHYHILSRLAIYIDEYMKLNKPLARNAESLCNQLSTVSL